jgi:uncharacterized repeat protein (TIGR03803 family)
MGGLVADGSGNLYGVTQGGGNGRGATQGGTLFELSPNGDGTWTHQVLHNFCAKADCTDGASPAFGLIIDTNGRLYGTTQSGGAHDAGVLFRLAFNAGLGRWNETVLYDFCAAASCTDGEQPAGVLTYQGAASGIPYDGTAPLYATTTTGGTHGGGVVFRLAHAMGSLNETVLYNFCASAGCPDGQTPSTGVVIDGTGALFGTTVTGGTNNQGALFKLTKGNGNIWGETVLASFCNQDHCTDGAQPSAVPVIDGSGTLYGVTISGGNQNRGLIYSYASGSLGTVYAFCPGATCSDGALPASPMILDGSGNLFGTTEQGVNGNHNFPTGKVFEWNGTYQVLYNFCTHRFDCTDGKFPSSGLLLDGSGDLFGETLQGGAGGGSGGGTVYELVP